MKDCKLITAGESFDGRTSPAGVPHQPYNPTAEPVRAVIARTDPNEQESAVLLD